MGKQVGNYIKELREKKGLSQGDVARLLNLKTAQSISNIERGVSPLPKAKIKKLADILGIRKSEIVTIVLNEVQDRYSKAAGVNARTLVLPNELTSEEVSLLKDFTEKLKAAKAVERKALKQRLALVSRRKAR